MKNQGRERRLNAARSYMVYIPEKHKKYDLLPRCRTRGGEVFSYSSDLIDKLVRYLPKGYNIDPYGYLSYDEYYQKMDRYAKKYFKDSVSSDLYKKFKEIMYHMNIKENWSVLRYIGESDNRVFGLTKGRTYYWPCSLEYPMYEGVIDDEEFTSYAYFIRTCDWEILEDPTGMAYRKMYGK